MDILEDENKNKQDGLISRVHFGARSYGTTLLTTTPPRISI